MRSTGREYEHDWVMVFALRRGRSLGVGTTTILRNILVVFRGVQAPLIVEKYDPISLLDQLPL